MIIFHLFQKINLEAYVETDEESEIESDSED